jgi:hypothetical protein
MSNSISHLYQKIVKLRKWPINYQSGLQQADPINWACGQG